MSDEAVFGVGITVDGRILQSINAAATPVLGEVVRSQSMTFEPGVRVFKDGRVEIDAGVTLDEAALGFWRAVERIWPVYMTERSALGADQK